MATTTRTVHARQGDTLDLLLHRHTGRTAGTTEATLAANPGLAGRGPILPMGTLIELPDVAPQPTTSIWLSSNRACPAKSTASSKICRE